MRWNVRLFLALPTILLVVSSPLVAAVYTVDRGDDSAAFTACSPSVAADCTLRGAIIAANANPGKDAIVIGFSSIYGRFMLVSIPRVGSDSPQEGDLDITDDLLIDGELGVGATILGVDPLNDRILDVALGVELELNDLVISGGRGPASECGGGIRTAGSDVLLNRVEVRASGADSGGGICVTGGTLDRLRLVGAAVNGNTAASLGGGIYVLAGSLELVNTTLSGNSAVNFGGAIMIGQTLTRSVSLTHVTLFDNATTGLPNAELYLHDNFNDTVEIIGSVIEGDCHDPSLRISSLGGNIEGPGDTCGLDPQQDSVGVTDMRLEALASFPGVVTRSHRPRWDSPAVDRLPPFGGSCPLGDQRMQSRPMDGNGDGVSACDAGAVEAPAALFVDGFESGLWSAWSSAVP